MDARKNWNFAAYLDQAEKVEMDHFATEEVRYTRPAGLVSLDYLAVADELHSGRIKVQADRRAKTGDGGIGVYRAELAAYLDIAEILEETPPTELVSDSIEPSDIAVELGLDQALPAELGSIRRHFAFANHPDRVAPHLRERAMVRMQVANMLIDAAQSKARLSTRL